MIAQNSSDKIKRARIIKELLDELRKNIHGKNELQLMQLELLKRKENRAVEENSDEAVEKIREYVEMKKQHIILYPALGLKSQTINGKMVISNLDFK